MRMRKTVALAVVVAAVLIGGVLLTTMTVPSPPPLDGCTRTPSQEMYQRGMYDCGDGTSVFTFASETARDSWIQAAVQAGTVVLSSGPTWAKVREAG